jgi:N-acetylneuraminic acid mutarotase
VFGVVPVALLDTCELYDPAAGTWTSTGSLLSTAAGPAGRALHTATLLPNGTVLVVGGLGANLDTPRNAQLYDPATGRWSQAGFFSGPRAGHTATLLANGKVLVAGGLNVAGSVPLGFRDSALLYDPASGAWSSTGSFVQGSAGPQGRSSHTATLLRDGRVLVVGGAAANLETGRRPQIYDPVTGRWSIASQMAEARANHTATLLPDGTILVAGGYRILGSVPIGVLASSSLYDPASNTWSATASLNVARAIHTATLLPDGTVLAVAGESANGRLDSAELYGR